MHAGHYTTILVPLASGQLRVWWAGDASTRAAATAGQRLVVTPRITARFALVRDHGVVIGATTRGAFVPDAPVAFTLAWQARSVNGQWYAICATTDAVTVTGGGFRGVCHLPGLAAGVWLRLAFAANGSTLLGSAASPPVRVTG